MELNIHDMQFAVRRLPTDIRSLLSDYPDKLFVAGGFLRAVVAGETPSDIDIFGISADVLNQAAKKLTERRGENTRLHKTKNALTVITSGRITVQFITRWVFPTPTDCASSFDFTVCQAAVWRSGDGHYRSICHDQFYRDLAARRLTYTVPTRDEEVGGSLMRVLKYVRRGYNIQADSLAAVVARLAFKVDGRADTEDRMHFVLRGLLKEVDPSIAVDGLDVHDDHETPIEGLVF